MEGKKKGGREGRRGGEEIWGGREGRRGGEERWGGREGRRGGKEIWGGREGREDEEKETRSMKREIPSKKEGVQKVFMVSVL